MPPLAPGDHFGAYRLIRPLGKGGFAEVWEAEHEGHGRRVALKVLTELRAESDRALERFQQEGRLAASLTSPRCVYVFDAGAHESYPYITMELMPGGTLADRIAEQPLRPREAVDYVLDVLDGLESAQQMGILHRDVKPSNVFLDAGGRAKIGDFGISKSLEVDSKLSQTGAFLGTPYYASPEQIASEPLDLRSDLYSVGAMLYELVTGTLPYAGTNASQVLAQVLTRDPVPFHEHAAQVPPGLQRVILRMLAKSPERRYQSYAQARAALLPFSSHGLTAGGPGRRFGAIVTDTLLFFPLGVAMSGVTLAQAFSGRLALAGALIPALQFVYFAVMEGVWGASLGKRLFGLRVTTPEGAAPSLARVGLRTLVFLGLYAGPGLLFQLITGAGVDLGGRPLLQFLPALLQLMGIAAVVCTMRSRNGYAGLHELASGTRVMALAARERPAVVPRTPRLPRATPTPPVASAFGPYQTETTLWHLAEGDGGEGGDEALLVARDEELGRDVWIHVFTAAAAVPSVERLRERGAGSLPWLQRGTTAGGATWDAYGAPQGAAFVAWAAERGGLAWREMREVLSSLSSELAARFAREGDAGRLTPDHVWVDSSGRALLLDFPASGPPPGRAESAPEVTPAGWREFLTRVAEQGFMGRPGGLLPPAVPVPAYAREMLASLASSGTAPPIEDFIQALERVAARPAEVSRVRRAGPFAVLALAPLFILLVRFVLVPLTTAQLPQWYRDIAVHGQTYLRALAAADSLAETDTTARRTAQAIRIVLASAFDQARRRPEVSNPVLAGLTPQALAVIDSAAARYPEPDSQLVNDARTWLTGRVELPRIRTGLAVVPKALVQSFTAVGWLGALGVLLALALRGGVLFTLFGVAVQRNDGVPAGRLRCAARALVGWSPLLLLLFLGAVPTGVHVSVGPLQFTPPSTDASDFESWTRLLCIAFALAGTAFAIWKPARGLAEWVTGTVLVPK